MRLIPALAEHLTYRIACGDLIEKWLSAQVNYIINNLIFIYTNIYKKFKEKK
jgi:hypothetical protein